MLSRHFELNSWRIALAVSMFVSFVACGSTASKEPLTESDADIDAQVERIVSSLTHTIRVKGEELRRYELADRMAHYGVPGVSVAVFQNGEMLWARGFGVADAETGKPVTPDTLFQAASISKPVAGLAALRLVEEGVIDLDRDVNDYLESWKVPDGKQTADNPVTLRGLLTHTAGMTVHGFPGYAASAEVPTVTQILDGEPPANTEPIRNDLAPGTEFRYSGGGYTVMQLLMTDVTGKDFPSLLEEKVIQPLDLKNSTYRQPLPESRRAQASSAHDAHGERIEGLFHTYPELAAAGLWTTPSDLAAVAIEVQRSLRGESNRVLSQEMTEQMLEPGLNGQGLGFATYERGGHRYFGHGGSNEGFRCTLIASRDGGFGAAIMTNGERGGELYDELLHSIAEEYGWPGFERKEREAVTLDDAQKEEIAGVYEMPGVGEVEIFLDEGELWMSGIIFVRERVYASGPDELFLLNGYDMSVERAEDGTVESLRRPGMELKRK
jgi:CubicO group peptidase (beta-lactamase class C family)